MEASSHFPKKRSTSQQDSLQKALLRKAHLEAKLSQLSTTIADLKSQQANITALRQQVYCQRKAELIDCLEASQKPPHSASFITELVNPSMTEHSSRKSLTFLRQRRQTSDYHRAKSTLARIKEYSRKVRNKFLLKSHYGLTRENSGKVFDQNTTESCSILCNTPSKTLSFKEKVEIFHQAHELRPELSCVKEEA